MIRYLLVFAFLLRIAAAFAWQSTADKTSSVFRFGDSESYWTMAEKIASGQPYQYGSPDSKVFRAPVYPLFLAPFTSLETHLHFPRRTAAMAARVAGCILGTGAIWLIFLSANQLAGYRAGLCAAILATCYPGAIGMSVFLLSEAVYCPLMLLVLYFWVRFLTAFTRPPMLRWIVFAGIASGLATLARPSWLLWAPMWVGLLWLILYIGKRKQPDSHVDANASYFDFWLKPLVCFAVVMALTMSPWWVRNYYATGCFVPTTLQVGPSLYDSLHEGATGASDEGMAFSLPFENQLRQEYREDAESFGGVPFEYELNRRLANAAIDWALKNPSDVLRLSLVKFEKTWNPWPRARELGGNGVRVAEAIVYSLIVVLAVFAWYAKRDLRAAMLVYASPVLYFALLHSVFVGSVRYRQPAILALCILGGIGAAWMLDEITARRQRTQTCKQ